MSIDSKPSLFISRRLFCLPKRYPLNNISILFWLKTRKKRDFYERDRQDHISLQNDYWDLLWLSGIIGIKCSTKRRYCQLGTPFVRTFLFHFLNQSHHLNQSRLFDYFLNKINCFSYWQDGWILRKIIPAKNTRKIPIPDCFRSGRGRGVYDESADRIPGAWHAESFTDLGCKMRIEFWSAINSQSDRNTLKALIQALDCLMYISYLRKYKSNTLSHRMFHQLSYDFDVTESAELYKIHVSHV